MKTIFSTIITCITSICECFKKFGITNTLLSLFIVLIVILIGLELWNGNTISAIKEWKVEERTLNKDAFKKSQNFYSEIKQYMHKEVSNSNCDYMMLIEFHNGSENIMTNIDFCKFDVTLQVQNDNIPYIAMDDYVNQNIFKYDIFLESKIFDDGIATYTIDNLKTADRYFYNQIMLYDTNVSYIAITTINVSDQIVGMLAAFYHNEDNFDLSHYLTMKTKIENRFKAEVKNIGDIRS